MFKLFGSLFRAATLCAGPKQQTGMSSAKLDAVLDETDQEPQTSANIVDAPDVSSYGELRAS